MFFKENKQVGEVNGANMPSVENHLKKLTGPVVKTQDEMDLELAMELSKQLNGEDTIPKDLKKLTPDEVLAMCEKAVDKEMLKELMDVDISKLRAVKALLNVQSRSTEAAVKWVVDHNDDKDIDDPIELVEGPPPPTSNGDHKEKMKQSVEDTKKMIEKKKAEKLEREKKENIEAEKRRREFGKKSVGSNDDIKKMIADRERQEAKGRRRKENESTKRAIGEGQGKKTSRETWKETGRGGQGTDQGGNQAGRAKKGGNQEGRTKKGSEKSGSQEGRAKSGSQEGRTKKGLGRCLCHSIEIIGWIDQSGEFQGNRDYWTRQSERILVDG
jgi:hypothetical protein